MSVSGEEIQNIIAWRLGQTQSCSNGSTLPRGGSGVVCLTCTQHRGPFGGSVSLAGGLLLGTGQQPQLLLLLGLWSVLVGQLEQLCG